MGITIGVCDDNIYQVNLIESYIKKNEELSADHIFSSTNPEVFIEEIKIQRPQMVFLDIDMGDMSGIDLGEQIRDFDKDMIIVYITGHEKYAFDAFGVHAYQYLIKPISESKFQHVLSEGLSIIKQRLNEDSPVLVVKTKKEVFSVKYREILYFEKIGHKIKICTATREFFYYDNFANLLKNVGSDQFIQCHQGYIVNIDKVRGFRERRLILENGFELSVSRTYINDVKEMLSEKLFNGKA
jgi:DNA-binding LytR/AlgR family response regulator